MRSASRALLRLAGKIHSRVESLQPTCSDLLLPDADWSRCRAAGRRLEKAERRGWRLAAVRLRRELRQAMEQLRLEMHRIEDRLTASERPPRIASLREILDDLRFLPDSFDEVRWDLRQEMLSVTTEPIVLEGFPLGRFTISLDWTRIGFTRPYHVLAREPNPAASDEAVTHPHVLNGKLCEGRGAVSLRAALESGRLVDFFTIVDRILHTYHRGSPHSPLSEWGGVCCPGCGDRLSEDDLTPCERCESVLCLGCLSGCPACRGLFCASCLEPCAECRVRTCRSCLSSGAGCGSADGSECFDGVEPCEGGRAQNRDSEADTHALLPV
ncbi:MAG: hypothetical protein IT428_22420 [Planctomycetaceae bacterium]|nr:hypothetical protein [Planctomycetaceae bacterium]